MQLYDARALRHVFEIQSAALQLMQNLTDIHDGSPESVHRCLKHVNAPAQGRLCLSTRRTFSGSVLPEPVGVSSRLSACKS